MFTALGLPPSLLSHVCLCSCCPLPGPARLGLSAAHPSHARNFVFLPEKLPLTKLPAGNFSQHFTDPYAIHDFDFYISQMDDQLLEGEHS